MIIPIRCFTCNKVIANKWNTYCKLKEENIEGSEIFKKLGLDKYCCQRMLLSHVEVIDTLLKYSNHIDEDGNKYTCLPEKVHLKEHTDRPRIYDAV